ncbi:MAG: hypothetical protein LBH77_07250, partial [Tannerella sp.]|nr:hypothetical protein [Tannerella sp.]
MKKNLFYGFLFVIFMVTTFGMTSCEKDDDGGESGTLYRNWKSTENEGFFNIKKDGTLSFLSVNGVVTAKYKITSSVKQGVDFFEAKLVTKYTLE